MSKQLKLVAEQLEKAQSVNIIIHRNPDGDAIGSAVALREVLNNKNTVISCSTTADSIYEKVLGKINLSKKLSNAEVFVVVDCNEAHRTGFAKELLGKKLIVIDHHNKGNLAKTASCSLIEEGYCSTTEIIDDLLKEMHKKITPTIATAIFLGIFTDTGAFRHPNTSHQTLKRASRLISYGANVQKIKSSFLASLSPTKRKLWGEILMNIRINRLGIAVAVVTKEALKKTGSVPSDVFGLANSIALIEEAKASLVLIELDQGWRGVLRTRHHQVNISKLAKLLGGRGLKKAAGFTVTKSAFSDIISN